MTWEWWAGNAEDAAVTPAGRPTLNWAIGVIRDFLGETWLAGNAAQTGYVPLFSHLWWPHTNFRVVTRILELAARIALVTAVSGPGITMTRADTPRKVRNKAVTWPI